MAASVSHDLQEIFVPVGALILCLLMILMYYAAKAGLQRYKIKAVKVRKKFIVFCKFLVVRFIRFAKDDIINEIPVSSGVRLLLIFSSQNR
jgi:hypothetical protein